MSIISTLLLILVGVGFCCSIGFLIVSSNMIVDTQIECTNYCTNLSMNYKAVVNGQCYCQPKGYELGGDKNE